jgi:hypothetical protein
MAADFIFDGNQGEVNANSYQSRFLTIESKSEARPTLTIRANLFLARLWRVISAPSSYANSCRSFLCLETNGKNQRKTQGCRTNA